jgi:hypothetical protein
MGEERKVYKVLGGKARRKETTRKNQNGIRMDLREIAWGDMCIGFDWLRTGTRGGLL